MLVSVAMATYNGARFLREQLESLARQTQLPSELVVGECCAGVKGLTPAYLRPGRAPVGVDIRYHSRGPAVA